MGAQMSYWSDADMKTLTELRESRMSWPYIAEVLGRSAGAVKNKWKYERLTPEQRGLAQARVQRYRDGVRRLELQALRAQRPEAAPPTPIILARPPAQPSDDVTASGEWTPARYRAMNDAFCRAMRAAVATGKERAEIGVVTTPMTDMARLVYGTSVPRFGNCALADA